MCSHKLDIGVCIVLLIDFIYSIIKLIMLIVIIVFVQIKYIGNWDENTCPELQGLTLFWLIFNYIMLGVSIYYLIINIGISFCLCEYFDDYNYQY